MDDDARVWQHQSTLASMAAQLAFRAVCLAHLVWTSERKVLLRVTSVRIGIVACVYVMSSSIPSVFHIVTTQWTYCGQLLSDVFLSLTIAIAIAALESYTCSAGPL